MPPWPTPTRKQATIKGSNSSTSDKIAFFRNAPLPADARKAQIATLRRGLIPALTRMNNYSGAVDQYIELINNFPEDDTLVTEAALYALRYQRQQQLIDFYIKTVAQSPRDYRWSMVLARTQTNLEELSCRHRHLWEVDRDPSGPRRPLYCARRTRRTPDAFRRSRRRLRAHLSTWPTKIRSGWRKSPPCAPVRVKQRKLSLRCRPRLSRAARRMRVNYFEVARRLENWGMLDQARNFAEQGVNKAGTDLLASAEHHAGARVYVRIMTRLRQHEQAYASLQKALADSEATLPVLKDQIERAGLTGITDAKWRENQRRIRIDTARNGMAGALQELGSAVNTYFTPEERLAFAHFAESKREGMHADDVEKFAIPLAESASLADQEAHWRFDVIMQRAACRTSTATCVPLLSCSVVVGASQNWLRRWNSSRELCRPHSEARLCSMLPMPGVPPVTNKTNFVSYPTSRMAVSTTSEHSATSSYC